MLLGPGRNRSCINITAIDDGVEEASLELLTLTLYHYNNEQISSIQVLSDKSTLEIYILDDDSEQSLRYALTSSNRE